MTETPAYQPSEPGQVESRSTCIYAGCRKEAIGVLPRWRNHPDPGNPYKQDWPLCAEHSQQKAHPRDIDMRKFEPFEEHP